MKKNNLLKPVQLFEKIETPNSLSKIVKSIRPGLLIVGFFSLFIFMEEKKYKSYKIKNESVENILILNQYVQLRTMILPYLIKSLDLIEKKN